MRRVICQIILGILGFTQADLDRYLEVIQSTAHLILQFSQEGGLENASSF